MASWRLAWDLLTAITIPLMAEGAGRVLGESCKPEINRESHRKKTMRASGVTSIIRVNLNKLDFRGSWHDVESFGQAHPICVGSVLKVPEQ